MTPARAPRILQVSTVHAPDDTRIFERQATSLARAGYEVAFLVPCEREEVRNGVRILPLTLFRSRLLRLAFGGPLTLLECLREPADLVCVHDPELIPLAVQLRLLGRRAVYDAHEDYVAYFRGHPRLPAPLRLTLAAASIPLEAGARWLLDHVLAATPAIARRFGQRGCTVIQNFPPVPDLREDLEPHRERAQRIVYLGELNTERGAWQMLDALEIVAEQIDVSLAFAGRIQPESLRDELRQHAAWARVEEHGWLDRAGVEQLLDTSRVGLVAFQPLPNHTESQPRKLFEYMAAGLPVVASDFPLWQSFVERHAAGLAVAPDPAPLAEALLTLLRDPERGEVMGRAGHRAAQESYSWSAEEEKLLAVVESIVGPPSPSRGPAA